MVDLVVIKTVWLKDSPLFPLSLIFGVTSGLGLGRKSLRNLKSSTWKLLGKS